jgi:hypothetical protein
LLGVILLGAIVSWILGSYVTARLAASRPLKHALSLGIILLAATVATEVAVGSLAPAWYHAAAIAFVVPSTWLGGWFRERRLAEAGRSLSASG